jgi:hypothetical protein
MPTAILPSIIDAKTLSLIVNGLPLLALTTTIAYGLWMLPQIQTLIAAEGGRKKDLVRRSQVQGFDFDVLILIPFTQEKHYPALIDCLACLTAQQYPEHKVKWAILATTAVQQYQTTFESLAETNQSPLLWLNAPPTETEQSLYSWGTRHALSQWPAQLVAFLHPSDLVKPDFINQLTAKAYSHEVIQGYVASRDYAGGWLHKLLGVETRITSRIETAGRHHAKKPLILRDSGFAIKTTLLEQLPWPAIGGNHASWLYSLALAKYQVPIVWAPTVVVYKRLTPLLGETIQTLWQEAIIKLSLGLQSISLIFKKPSQYLLTALELTSYWCTIPWALTLAVATSLVYAGVQLNQPNTQISGIVLASMVVGIQLAVLGVSRLPWQDWVAFALLKPLLLILSTVAFPFILIKTMYQQLIHQGKNLFSKQAQKPQSKHPVTPIDSTRAIANDRKKPLKPQASTEEVLPYWLIDEAVASTKTTATDPVSTATEPTVRTKASSQNSSLEMLWKQAIETTSSTAIETSYTVPLLFGTKSVEANVEVETVPNKGIQLTLQYKQQSFKTAFYPLFSQAFYELQEKLSQYKIKLSSCGGCAYYFQPALAGTQQPQVGLCLKQVEQGVEENTLQLITVLSNACANQAPLSERKTILETVKNQLQSQPA